MSFACTVAEGCMPLQHPETKLGIGLELCDSLGCNMMLASHPMQTQMCTP